VNNIASAPNLVTINLSIQGQTENSYNPKSTDNGSNIILTSTDPISDISFGIFGGIVDNKNKIINGYYFKVINANPLGGNSIKIYSFPLQGVLQVADLAPGESIYYYQGISDLLDSNTLSTGWLSI
jgi:hypothetical protein